MNERLDEKGHSNESAKCSEDVESIDCCETHETFTPTECCAS